MSIIVDGLGRNIITGGLGHWIYRMMKVAITSIRHYFSTTVSAKEY